MVVVVVVINYCLQPKKCLAECVVLLLQILRTIPFNQINISILSVEYVHGRSGKRSYSDFMTRQGYNVHKDIHFHSEPMTLYVDDFIFVKKTLTL